MKPLRELLELLRTPRDDGHLRLSEVMRLRQGALQFK